MHSYLEYIKNELWKTNNYGLFNTEVNEFILKNVYGFELLAVPYIICHLRIHEYLETFGFRYTGGKKERAEVFLTNTLENSSHIQLTNFFDDIDEEADLAHKIKNEEEILVIMGNPPYSVSSSNKTEFIETLMKTYKSAVQSERNIQPLSDDYIKFLRFAHWKMENVDKGVICVITNNSFLDGVIHRGMREELSKTFDEIYILNLHGNSNIGETCSDGSKDENVFDIKQGVCISMFLKTVKKKTKESKFHYYSLQGLRELKYDFLYSQNVNTVPWEILKLEKPYFWFKKKDLKLQDEYSKFWSLVDVFEIYTSGIKTHNDGELVYLKSKGLNTEKMYFYRPFDIRFIEYDLEKVIRHRYSVMKHFLEENIGLCFVRQLVMNRWQHVFITDILSDICSVSINSKESTYVAPLYTFSNETKQYNFTSKFMEFWKNDPYWKEKNEQEILAYIYGNLFSPNYRENYFEFLKIDFPRVNFHNKNRDLYITIGQELIDLHLFKTEFSKDIANFPVTEPDLKVSLVKYQNQKLYINKTTYFDCIPEEVWNYEIGGYKVLDKWLKERKKHNYILTGVDLNHILKIINVINRTIELQEKL